jgi:hypothetical protein
MPNLLPSETGQLPTLLSWIQSQPFSYSRRNVRNWGTYELEVTLDGKLVHFQTPHGWGIPENEAFEYALTELWSNDNFRNQLKDWVGDARFDSLTSILGGSIVPEHLREQSNG